MCYNVPVVYALKGRLHDAVKWYGINYAGTQATQCEFRCFESPTVKLVSQRNLFRTMWTDRAKAGLFIYVQMSN